MEYVYVYIHTYTHMHIIYTISDSSQDKCSIKFIVVLCFVEEKLEQS